jgi:hypothetical protein
VDYPDVDLRFVNDTAHWLLLRTFVGSYSLTVGLYGAPQHRRVVTEARPLVETGPPPIKHEPDPSLTRGRTVVVDGGEPSALDQRSGGLSTSAGNVSTTTPGTPRTGASPRSCSSGRSRSPCLRRRKRSRP